MSQTLSHEQLAIEFERRGPWMSRFDIDGHTYGGPHFPERRARFFRQHVAPRSRVLELGSLEGAETFQLASDPEVAEVVAIEGRAENIERARFVQGVLGLQNISFLHRDLTEFDIAELGVFGAVLCAGLLYHLAEPRRLIQQCLEAAPSLFLWTHYAPPPPQSRP